MNSPASLEPDNPFERDALTGLLNRRALMPRLHAEHERSVRNQHPYSIAMLDIDHFKRINDTYGHATGDEALQTIATILQANCRGIATLERIRHAVEKPAIAVNKIDIPLTISIGVASFSSNMTRPNGSPIER